ncbi:MAG: non-heme iron oxygenase ferredoxin subunit [Methanobacteriota archaeon]|nr:MAG: non-heme iron oxygenase ferredoxin subunit [Euryarchaeota archaeon]
MRVGLAAEEDIPQEGTRCVEVGGRRFALFKVNGQVYCLDNTCTHLGGPLCEGRLAGFVVQCPWHGSRFDVRSGQVVGPPARSAVRSYPTTVEAGKVWADLP